MATKNSSDEPKILYLDPNSVNIFKEGPSRDFDIYGENLDLLELSYCAVIVVHKNKASRSYAEVPGITIEIAQDSDVTANYVNVIAKAGAEFPNELRGEPLLVSVKRQNDIKDTKGTLKVS
jgi:hypothetical protein